jgi:lipopolysaccharide export system protein LptA
LILARFFSVRALTAAAFGLSLALLVPAPASAQDNILTQGKGPLAIDADNGIEWRRDEQVYVADGHAKAVRGDVTVYADRLVAHYRAPPQKATDPKSPDPKQADKPAGTASAGDGGNIYRVDAIGHVVIETPSERAVGDHGIYDLDKAVMVLTGNGLKLTTPTQQITARDSLEYWDQRKLAVARGDAVAIEKDRRVAGDVLTAHVTEDPKTKASKISRVDAFGNVRVSTPTQIAQGAKGVYNLETQIATLVDHVRVTQGTNQLNGDYAEVNLNTGVSRMLSGNAAGKAGARVSALIVPNQGTQPVTDDTGTVSHPGSSRKKRQ